MNRPATLPPALKPYRVSSAFGIIRRINGKDTPPHNGCDWATPHGVRLTSGIRGRVTLMGGSLAHIWGYYVHTMCDCPARHTEEFHILRELPSWLRVGSRVEVGTLVGYTGSSGSLNGKRYAPHHHYGTSENGKHYNPLVIGWPSSAGTGAAPIPEAPAAEVVERKHRDMFIHWDTNGTGWFVTSMGRVPIRTIQDAQLLERVVGKQDTFNLAQWDIVDSYVGGARDAGLKALRENVTGGTATLRGDLAWLDREGPNSNRVVLEKLAAFDTVAEVEAIDSAAIAEAVAKAVVANLDDGGDVADVDAIAKAVDAVLADNFAALPGAVADEERDRLAN